MMHWLAGGVVFASYAEVPNVLLNIPEPRIDWGDFQVVVQGVVLSESKTPRSRAICSRVIGRKEPSHIRITNQVIQMVNL